MNGEKPSRPGLLSRGAERLRSLAGYPRRRVTPARAAAGATYREIHPPRTLSRRPPRGCETPPAPEFRRWATEDSPATFVLTLEGARCGVAGLPAVFDREEQLVEELSPLWFDAPALGHPCFRMRRLGRAAHLPGRVLNLLSLAPDNYAHWTLDVLPRAFLALEAGHSPAAFSHVLIGGADRPFKRHSLEAMGFPPGRLLFVGDGVAWWRADALVCPSYPGRLPGRCAWVVEKARSLRPAPSRGGRRLLLSRAFAPSRKLLNEDALSAAVLAPLGFERVHAERLSWREQARLFAEASFIVAPHGAGLANLAYCSPGTALLELFHPRYVHVQYWRLAESAGLAYHYLLGDGAADAGHEDVSFLGASFEVSATRLRRALAAIPL